MHVSQAKTIYQVYELSVHWGQFLGYHCSKESVIQGRYVTFDMFVQKVSTT